MKKGKESNKLKVNKFRNKLNSNDKNKNKTNLKRSKVRYRKI